MSTAAKAAPAAAVQADEPAPRISAAVLALAGKQASLWNFIDQVLVKYGPLGVMLCAVVFYVVKKDEVIEKKDALLMSQQSVLVDMTRSQAETMAKAAASQIDVARAVEENTRTMQRLVNVLEVQSRR